MNIRSQIDTQAAKVPTYPPTYVEQRPTLDAFLSGLADEYRRAFDLTLPECLSLAVSAFVMDVRRPTGGRISVRAAEGLLLGL